MFLSQILVYDAKGTVCHCRGYSVDLNPDLHLVDWLNQDGKKDEADAWENRLHTPLELFHQYDLPPCRNEFSRPYAPENVVKKRGKKFQSREELEGYLKEYLNVVEKLKTGERTAEQGRRYLLKHTQLDFDLDLIPPQKFATPIWDDEEVGKAKTGPRQQKVHPRHMPPGIVHLGHKYRWEGASTVEPWHFYHCVISSCAPGCRARIKVKLEENEFEVEDPHLAVGKHFQMESMVQFSLRSRPSTSK